MLLQFPVLLSRARWWFRHHYHLQHHHQQHHRHHTPEERNNDEAVCWPCPTPYLGSTKTRNKNYRPKASCNASASCIFATDPQYVGVCVLVPVRVRGHCIGGYLCEQRLWPQVNASQHQVASAALAVLDNARRKSKQLFWDTKRKPLIWPVYFIWLRPYKRKNRC